ncbi:protein of unknown function DUF1444 [Acetivibrio thermocellus ATCC 27405]|uniref:DUF1444 domain-containing protein n=1 Tax=Acetivibrio thermocellus (strain ATCC 27405 / DSM 1237 / JCM 9322 / NBRC 103400 / NCIMB 10682 / NRRL B-4536 / VPI 7372) TaxID=203119 RepID=A3DEI5_ACET2|nr:DUF1444 family protein [Acetivibrio thermocellus]ABN52364.1 protein of unknown function DUF1444 [Acetivibrio thermocellus ATCC 27405]
MLTVQEFVQNISEDFKKVFPEVRVEDRFIRLGTEVTHVELPINSMYKEYQVTDYESIKKLYIKVSNEILNQYKFKVDYNNVYPLLKSREFGKGEKDLGFYREQAFADIDIFYASDIGEVFRFILNSDDVDFDKMKKAAWENLNKMANPLVKLDKTLDVFCLKYSTDYNSTLLLSTALQNQIHKKIGKDYLFAIPSSTTLIVARYRPEYISIIKSLMAIDTDTNRISDKVYQYKNGIFDIASV